MKTIDRFLSMIGVDPARRIPPPDLLAIADGLLVTTTKTEAWFEVRTSNTDLADPDTLETEIRQVIRTAGKILTDKDCHLKVVWGTVDGAAYAEDAHTVFRAGMWQEWAGMTAARIDELNLPDRHILLGVELDAFDGRVFARTRTQTGAMLGMEPRRVPDGDLVRLLGQVKQIGRSLQSSPLRARPASAEVLAWSIAREQYRTAGAIARHGSIQGAALAHLTRGRVVPFHDHLRIHGTDGSVAAYAAVLALADFPEELDVPGNGEWLRTLSEIVRIDETGAELPVIVDASVRFRVLSRQQSLKLAERTRTAAKEQRQSAAKHAAGETSTDIEDSEQVAEELVSDIRRQGLMLVNAHPRLLITGSSRDELAANIDAVISHYAGRGITAVTCPDEQRDLWLEQLPGDALRVPDLGHIQEDIAFFGSLFWGGSTVGDTTGPVRGYLTGSTPGLFRFSAIGGAKRGDATTTALLGRSGRGKTVAGMLLELDAAFAGAWTCMPDFKGDSGGVVDVAQQLGLPADLIRIGAEHAGAADLFGSIPLSDAPLQVTRQLTLLAPGNMRQIAETACLDAANRVAGTIRPTTAAVIDDLTRAADPDTARLGHALLNLAGTPLGAIVAGRPTGRTVLRRDPGVWNIQLPGLVLPSTESNPDTWDASQRVSLAAMRGITMHALHVSSDPQLRGMPKLIFVPEVHRMLRTDDGRDFLDQVARMGRAFDASLLLDSQDADGIAGIEGLVEQLSTVFAFQMTTARQQDALAELLHLPIDDSTRTLIRELAAPTDDGDGGEPSLRKGHCIMRDWRDQAATVQFDYPAAWVADALSTNADRTAAAAEERTAA